MRNGEAAVGGGFPDCRIERPLLVQRSAHAYFVDVVTSGALHSLRRAAGDIGLSSLTGGNDFGFLIAHSYVSYWFGLLLRPRPSFRIIARRFLWSHIYSYDGFFPFPVLREVFHFFKSESELTGSSLQTTLLSEEDTLL